MTESMVHDLIKAVTARLVEGELLTNESVAEMSGYTRWHLQREFKRIAGFQLGQFMRNLRLNVASTLLTTTDRSIMDIAIHAGYSEQQTFTRAFSQKFGIAPDKYRKAHRSK